MNTRFWLIGSVFVFAILSAGCDGQARTAAAATPTAVSQPDAVTDVDSLMETLRVAGASVEPGDKVEQPFFSVTGQLIKVNGADVQVFVYDTAEAMETEASQVAEDGSSIGTNMLMWMDVPHFYKSGRLLALYVGQDQTVIDLLEGVLGPQFAGS